MIDHSFSSAPACGLAGALLLWGGLACASGVELPVPTITIYPGETIGENLLVDRPFQVGPSENWPVHKDRGALVGKVARRTLLPGKPIPLNAVREADVVRRGKPVTIVFQAGGLTITGQAMPLQAGAVGDTLTLRNADSGGVVRGIVQADGTVRVNEP
jgi:flagellar basal body P-ring formation protein FlgA